MDNIKKPMEAGMLCTINDETFHLFIKNTWIGSLGDLCYMITMKQAFMTSSKSMSWYNKVQAICLLKKGQLCMKVCQVDGSKRLHVLWLIKLCAKAGANHYSLTCKLSQRSNILSGCKNIIVVQSTSGYIVLDCWIKTHYGWVPEVKFIMKPQRGLG